ncbi:DUF6249 domain-containing protein [Lacibacter sp. H407]|uniref:DUF6249 domain-containing protein n=1 Tax=Lacibacter sp. H407 TaxID=3133423 RepID=UPI0030BAA0BB
MGPEILIPILVPLGAMALAFGLYYLRNKENMTMIEKGMNPKEFANRPAPYRNLKWGLLLVGAGVGLFLAYIMHTYVLKIDDDNPVMYFSLLAICGGIGLILSYRIEKKEVLDKE